MTRRVEDADEAASNGLFSIRGDVPRARRVRHAHPFVHACRSARSCTCKRVPANGCVSPAGINGIDFGLGRFFLVLQSLGLNVARDVGPSSDSALDRGAHRADPRRGCWTRRRCSPERRVDGVRRSSTTPGRLTRRATCPDVPPDHAQAHVQRWSPSQGRDGVARRGPATRGPRLRAQACLPPEDRPPRRRWTRRGSPCLGG